MVHGRPEFTSDVESRRFVTIGVDGGSGGAESGLPFRLGKRSPDEEAVGSASDGSDGGGSR